jgi:hypothetical protein
MSIPFIFGIAYLFYRFAKEAMGMKRINVLFLAVLSISLLLIFSACSPSRVSVEEFNQEQGVSPTSAPEEVQETEEMGTESDTSSGEVVETPIVADVTGNVPEDVPVLDDAYRLVAGSSGKNVVYQVDTTIEEVVTFYQNELPNFGWEMAGPPDNQVATIATMLRENADGDRLAINMQRNELGGFVRVTVTISRAD